MPGTRSSPTPPPAMAPRSWTSTRSGKKSRSIPSICPRTASTRAPRGIRRWPKYSPRHWLMLGRRPKPSIEPRLAPRDGAVVDARDLFKTYRLGRVRVPALRGVTLRIERGEIVAIVGPSGCGKTTLLHCLSGLEDFDSGDVLLEGQRLAALSDS